MGREAVVGAVEPALAEVAVADRRPRHLARQAQQERLVDRAGDRVGVEPPVPAAQPLQRAALALAAAACSRPSRRAASRPGIERLSDCIASKPSRSCSSLARSSSSIRLRAEAVEPFAGDVVRVLVADDAVVGGDQEAALGVDHLRQLLVGDRPLPLELAAPAGLRQVGAAAAAQRQAADQLVADRAVAVGPDQVRGRRGVALQLRDQLRAGARSRAARTCPRRRSARSSAIQRSASGSASSAPSASLTIGPWWVRRTSSTSGASRPLTRSPRARSPAAATRPRTGSGRPRPARRRGPGRRPSRW